MDPTSFLLCWAIPVPIQNVPKPFPFIPTYIWPFQLLTWMTDWMLPPTDSRGREEKRFVQEFIVLKHISDYVGGCNTSSQFWVRFFCQLIKIRLCSLPQRYLKLSWAAATSLLLPKCPSCPLSLLREHRRVVCFHFPSSSRCAGQSSGRGCRHYTTNHQCAL